VETIMQSARQQTFDVLVVREMDRLARSRFKQMLLEHDLAHHGVMVEYVLGQYEETAEGRLLKGLVAEVAEYERLKILERTQRGKLRSLQAGSVATGGLGAPFGYTLATTPTGERTLVVCEEEAAVVRLIFALYEEGKSRREICDALNERALPRPGKGAAHHQAAKRDGWAMGTVLHILKNETYVGRWHYQKTVWVEDETGRKHSLPRPKEEWLVVAVPALIKPAQWEAIQERRASNKRLKGRQRKHTYAIGGMVTCGACGSAMSGVTKFTGDKPYTYYRCNAVIAPIHHTVQCRERGFPLASVEATVWRWVKDLLLDPEVRKTARDEAELKTEEKQAGLRSMLASSQKRLEELTERKQRLVDAYLAGALSVDELVKNRAPLDAELNGLTQAVQKLQGELARDDGVAYERLDLAAHKVRAALDFYDQDQGAQREVYTQLRLTVTLTRVDGEMWATCECLLGERRLAVEDKSKIDLAIARG
jgi:site-specific DNA recombinase